MPDQDRKLVGSTQTTRGCAHRCKHCPIPSVYEGRLRVVQEQVVLADIDNLVAMGAEHISFGDPDFLNGVKYSLRIVRAMNKKHAQISFDITAKVEHLLEYPDVLCELGELGCLFVVSAVETVDDRILKYLDKGKLDASLWSNALELKESLDKLIEEHREYMDHMKHHH